MAVTLATLISAYQARLNDVLSASGPGPSVDVIVDDIQPLLEQPSLLGEARAEVWCSGTERATDIGGGVSAEYVRDTIEVSVDVDAVLDQRPAFEQLLNAEDRVRVALLCEWDGAPCASLFYQSTARTRDGSALSAVMTFEATRLQANT